MIGKGTWDSCISFSEKKKEQMRNDAGNWWARDKTNKIKAILKNGKKLMQIPVKS